MAHSLPPMVLGALGALPVLTLLSLVLLGRCTSLQNALITTALTVVLALSLFASGPVTTLVGLSKGMWVGVWILCVIVPALLLHHAVSAVGMNELGEVLGAMFPHKTQNVLVLAWLLPSTIQGVSGFGVPIAVSAPLLVALGVRPVLAVALPLIGYHWAVGFGSMGSSFYMAALTAHLNASQTRALAVDSAILLGAGCLLAGVLVAWLFDGLRGVRHGLPLLLTCGPVMMLVQFVAVHGEPGIGSLVAGVAGLVVAVIVRPLTRRGRTEGLDPLHVAGDSGTDMAEKVGRARAAAIPFLVLAVLAVAVMVPPSIRAWAQGRGRVSPSFPATPGGVGGPVPAVEEHTPIVLLTHPGTFLIAALVISLMVWVVRGRWHRTHVMSTLRSTVRQAGKSGPPIVLLAAVAGLMVDSGMVAELADTVVARLGAAYVWAVPAMGALGSFITGSTTNSNALFSALQVHVADSLGLSAPAVLAGQLAGGNVGNSIAPVVILMGLSAVGAENDVGLVTRRTLGAAVVLLAVTTVGSAMLVHVS